ncbi:NAD(P)H-dependent oxidoreductase subunit E, partial [Planctomycetota bacterium]
MEKLDLTFVNQAVKKIGTGAEDVLEILQAVQGHFGYLPKEALERVCEVTQITPVGIAGVSTFYNQFRHHPVGKHIIHVCVGTACHVKGADRVYEAFQRHLGISKGEDTDAQKIFTVEKIACLGCCTLAPAVQIDEVTYGHLSPSTVSTVVSDFLRYAESKAGRRQKIQGHKTRQLESRGEVRLGLGSCCIARGSGKLRDALEQTLAQTGIELQVKRVGCVGMCHQTPLLEVVLPDNKSFLYARVQPEDAKAIVLRHFKLGGIKKITNSVSQVVDNFLTDEQSEPVTRYSIDVRDRPVADFLGRQRHIATEHHGDIDPVDMDEYLSHDGFNALKRCIQEMSPEEVIGEVERSGLRGRGGAGFPTHLKWSAVRSMSVEGVSPSNRGQDARDTYLVCNGDEGDPGAFMDRMLMESYPYRIIEGMVIAAYAVGANKGYFYIRGEYPLATERISLAIEKCKQHGFLGDDILNSGFSLHLKIVPGAGAFVCGEETALLASIEGRRGMPRLRPPFPAQRGLWGRPTLINNVETYAAVPWIIRNGSEAFAEMGTSSSKGTKVFALAGKVDRVG